MYEPDPLKITSMEEMDSCEKNLVDTLATVMQRKVHIKPLVIFFDAVFTFL